MSIYQNEKPDIEIYNVEKYLKRIFIFKKYLTMELLGGILTR